MGVDVREEGVFDLAMNEKEGAKVGEEGGGGAMLGDWGVKRSVF